MIRRVLMMSAALVCGAAAVSPPSLSAQAAADSTVVEAQGVGAEAPAGVGDAAAATPTSSGLPQRAAPPRTMADKWPVFVAFAVTWVGIIGYFLQGNRHSAGLAKRLIAREEKR